MASYSVKCPHCQRELTVQTEWANMQTACPICQKSFIIPAHSAPQEAPQSRAAADDDIFLQPSTPRPPRETPRPPRETPRSRNQTKRVEDCFVEDVQFLTAWRKFLMFSGRSTRKEYFFFILSLILVNILAVVICCILKKQDSIPTVANIINLLSLTISVPLTVRRLHDTGLSGWWIILFFLTPVLLFLPSQPGMNEHGYNPVGVASEQEYTSDIYFSWLRICILVWLLPVLTQGGAAGLLLPALIQARERARRINCSSNLKQISTAIQLYSSCYKDYFPEDFQALNKKDFITDKEVFLCPTSLKQYIYLGKGLRAGDNADVPVVIEFPGSHDKFVNIAYAGGYVRGHILSKQHNSCVDIINEIAPDLSKNAYGRLALENAKKVDRQLQNNSVSANSVSQVEEKPTSRENSDTTKSDINKLLKQGKRAADLSRNKEAESYFRQAKALGSAEAAYQLAVIVNDPEQAAQLIREAAEKNHAQATASLGAGYAFGQLGFPKDKDKANQWFARALPLLLQKAEQGDYEAMKMVSKMYSAGLGVAQNSISAKNWEKKAISALHNAANEGNVEAQKQLGSAYKYGQGVEKNPVEAVKWYRKAADNGCNVAQTNLAACYHYGQGVEMSDSTAVYWYRKAAEQGDLSAMDKLGDYYKKGEGVEKNPVEAVKWYRQAAELDYSSAQLSLSSCYDNGTGVEKNPAEAQKWMLRAAENGSQLAMIRLGRRYKEEQNDYEAFQWFKTAEKQFIFREDAQYELALCYEEGRGTEQNYSEAFRLYKLVAANAGDYSKKDEAQYKLGVFYENGYAVAQNTEEAIKWYRKAAKGGNADAKKALKEAGIEY